MAFMKIEDVIMGKTYACKFKVETMLDTFGRLPGLSDVPLRGPDLYEGFGTIKVRDMKTRLVRVVDEESRKEFVVSFDDIWDIDEAFYRENPLGSKNKKKKKVKED